MALRIVALALCALVLAACKRDAPPTGSVPSAKSSALDAAAAADAKAAFSTDALERNNRPVDLVFATRTAVAVSSKVDNPRDYPEHLIDGKKETAWNGKTGNLVGGWIAFRVPKEAHVARVEIIVGFDKTDKAGLDLFTANHRIKRVRLYKDGTSIGEHTFDVNARGLQSITVDREGGEYRLEVLETTPGSKTAWKELVVSEFHVIGTVAQVTREVGEQPRVFVGSLDPPKTARDPARTTLVGWFPSLEALCKTPIALVTPTLPAAEKNFRENFGMDDLRLAPRCEEKKLGLAAQLAPPFLELSSVTMETGGTLERVLAVRTEAGWTLVRELALSVELHYDPGCASIFRGADLQAASVAEAAMPVLVVTQEVKGIGYAGSGEYLDAATRRIVACRKAAEGLVCDAPVDVNYAEALPGTPLRWRADAKYELTRDGHVKWLAPPR